MIGFHLTFDRDARPRPARHAAPHLHLRARPRVGHPELLVTIGAFIQAVAHLVFVANLVVSYWKGAKAGNDPWDAWTLEWSVELSAARLQLCVHSRQSPAAGRCGI